MKHKELDPTLKLSSDLDRAWAAGLFDGEGCSFASHRVDGGRTIVVALGQSSNSESPEVLNRFLHIVRVGSINRMTQRTLKTPYEWRTASYSAVWFVMMSLWPWLGEVKRNQFVNSLTQYLNHKPRRKT